MTAGGGFATMHAILQCVDALRIGGWRLLAVYDVESLGGFLLYGVFPFALYLCGTGVLIGYRWARAVSLWFVLPLGFVYAWHAAYRVLVEGVGRPLPVQTLNRLYPEIFVRYVAVYAVFALIGWMVLSSPSVRSYCDR